MDVMSYPKSSDSHYSNFGGVNEKASKYTTQQNQALNLRNIDFYIPNAWSKTPGSSLAIASGTSGVIRSLFEFERLDGASFLLAGSNNELLRSDGISGWSSISTGWTNGQKEDFLPFLNKAWVANGQYWGSYDGTSFIEAGLPNYSATTINNSLLNSVGLTTSFSVLGVTADADPTVLSNIKTYLWGAYRYRRADGYYGPLEFFGFSFVVGSGGINILSPNVLGISPKTLIGTTYGGNYGDSITLRIVHDLPTSLNSDGVQDVAFYVYVESYTNLPEVTKEPFYTEFGQNNELNTGFDFSNFRLLTHVALGSTFVEYSGLPSWSVISTSELDYPRFSGMVNSFFETYTPKYIEQNLNRMYVSGFSNALSTVFFSEIAAPEVYEPESFFEVRTDDGDRILAMKQYQNQVIIFKKKSFHKLVGSTANSFQLVELSNEYGCLSNDCVVEFNNKILFLDQEGIVEFNGADWNIISTPIEPTIRRINVDAAIEKAVAVHYIERNQVWFGVPIDGSSENNLVIVYDYLLKGWTFINGFNPSAFAPAKQSLNKRTVHFGDYSGSVQYMSPSLTSYNGSAFTCVIETKFDSPDGSDVENIFRRLFLDLNTVGQSAGIVDVEVLSNYDRSTVKATFSISQDTFQTRSDFGVTGKSSAFKFYYSNDLNPLTINGYNVQRRFLRKV